MSDSLDHDFINKEQLEDLQQCIEAQKRRLDSDETLDEYEDTKTSFECDSGGFVEVSRGTDSGFIQITARGGLSDADFGRFIDEIVQSVEQTTPATLSVALTTDSVARYDVAYPETD